MKILTAVWGTIAVITLSVSAEEVTPAYEVFELMSASSPSDSRSKEWQPGDGITMEVSGMAWFKGSLAVAIRKGEIWLIDSPLSLDKENIPGITMPMRMGRSVMARIISG